MREGDTLMRSESTGGEVQTAAPCVWCGVRLSFTGHWAGTGAYCPEGKAVGPDGTSPHAIEAAPSAGLPAEALLREVVRNGVPPDALMTPKDGPAHENLYRWWHEQWAPTLQKVRAALAAAPEAGLPDGLGVERAYELGWIHGRDGEPPNPRAAIEGLARLRATEASPKIHRRQSLNGCVTCPRRWSEHTQAERASEPGAYEIDDGNGHTYRFSGRDSEASDPHRLDR